MATTTTRMQQRRDTTANWETVNPVLLLGEMGYDTDVDKFKIGDGATAWLLLPYLLEAEVEAAQTAQAAAEAAAATAGDDAAEAAEAALAPFVAGIGTQVDAAAASAQAAEDAAAAASTITGLTGEDAAMAFIAADEDSDFAGVLKATFTQLAKVASTVTASGAGVVWKHNPVDATGAARAISLPTGQAEGTMISVEKVDASTNAVTVTGSVRGVGASTLTLSWQYDSIALRADAAGSWWPLGQGIGSGARNIANGVAALNVTGSVVSRKVNNLGAPVSNNTAVGTGSMSVPAAAAQSTAVGYQALTALTDGYGDTAVGADALKACTTGGFNTAVGAFAADAITTGAFNTAVGHEALSAAAADNNVAVGYRALYACAGGYSNVAVGYRAARSITTARENVAIGVDALDVTTTGDQNIAIGRDALGANTTGRANTAVGDQAMILCTTGYTNTGVGQLALGTLVDGIFNTGVGHGAGYGLVDGKMNTSLGFEAGHRHYDETKVDSVHGDYNTFVGSRASLTSESVDPNSVVAIGFGSQVGADNSVAIGGGTEAHRGARVGEGHTGSVAIGVDSSGTGSDTTAADQIMLGTSSHRVQVPGRLNVATRTPSGSADAQGAVRDIATDDSYVYVKTSGGWKRAALSTF